MNRVDKLILKARAAAATGKELGAAFIEKDGDSWTAVVYIHDRTQGQGHTPTIKRATWATPEGAVEYIQAIAAEYPNSKDLTIIIDDLG